MKKAGGRGLLAQRDNICFVIKASHPTKVFCRPKSVFALVAINKCATFPQKIYKNAIYWRTAVEIISSSEQKGHIA